MNRKIVLVGGGGHCKSVLDSLLACKEYKEIGIIDKKENVGKKILGISVIGCDDDLDFLKAKGYVDGFVTIGSVGNTCHRRKLFDLLKNFGYHIPNIIDITSNVSKYAKLTEGIFIGKSTVVNAEAEIKDGVIVNTGAVIEHDCKIGSFVHIAPGVVLGGEVIIGDNTHVGSNSVVKQKITIGTGAIIGMGSVVTKDVESNCIAYGSPCRKMGIK